MPRTMPWVLDPDCDSPAAMPAPPTMQSHVGKGSAAVISLDLRSSAKGEGATLSSPKAFSPAGTNWRHAGGYRTLAAAELTALPPGMQAPDPANLLSLLAAGRGSTGAASSGSPTRTHPQHPKLHRTLSSDRTSDKYTSGLAFARPGSVAAAAAAATAAGGTHFSHPQRPSAPASGQRPRVNAVGPPFASTASAAAAGDWQAPRSSAMHRGTNSSSHSYSPLTAQRHAASPGTALTAHQPTTHGYPITASESRGEGKGPVIGSGTAAAASSRPIGALLQQPLPLDAEVVAAQRRGNATGPSGHGHTGYNEQQHRLHPRSPAVGSRGTTRGAGGGDADSEFEYLGGYEASSEEEDDGEEEDEDGDGKEESTGDGGTEGEAGEEESDSGRSGSTGEAGGGARWRAGGSVARGSGRAAVAAAAAAAAAAVAVGDRSQAQALALQRARVAQQPIAGPATKAHGPRQPQHRQHQQGPTSSTSTHYMPGGQQAQFVLKGQGQAPVSPAGGQRPGGPTHGSTGWGGGGRPPVHPAASSGTAGTAAAAAAAGAYTGPPWHQQQHQGRRSSGGGGSGGSGSHAGGPGSPLVPTQGAVQAVASALAALGFEVGAARGSNGAMPYSRDGSTTGSRPATASSAWSGYDLQPSSVLLPDPNRRASGSGAPAAMALPGRSIGSAPAGQGEAGRRGGGAERGAGRSTGRGNTASSPARRRAASNPRDAAARSGGGGATAARAASRCSSASSTGRTTRAATPSSARSPQMQAILATLGLSTPSTPAAGAARLRQRAVPQYGSGPPTPSARANGTRSAPLPSHRPLHPAVLALATSELLQPPTRAVLDVPTDAKNRPYPYILPPDVPGTNPTVAFVRLAAEKQAAGLQPLLQPTLYVKYGGVANGPVKHAFREAGLRTTKKGKRWLVQWGGILDAAAFAKLHAFQRVNHFPGTWELGHKGHLYRNVYNARRRARGITNSTSSTLPSSAPGAAAAGSGGAPGAASASAAAATGPPSLDNPFDIVPRFYLLPRDYDEFRNDSERFPERLYIQKPTNSSRGRGIRMVTRPDSIPRDAKDTLVQHYIANPLLLDGYKFDMRVYATATCLDPLRLYVYPDGLARLAAEPYSADKADLSKRCVHLTNYSVNKKSNKFVAASGGGGGGGSGPGPGAANGGSPSAAAGGGGGGQGSAASLAAAAQAAVSRPGPPADPLAECGGSKWSLAGLRAHLEARGLGPGWEAVWRQVCDIIAAAVIAAEPRMNTECKMKVPHRNNCFEVWGFDIMLTDTFRAWLIEANTCPSLAADSPLDMRVKVGMVAELMHLVGPVPYDVEVYEKQAEAQKQARLTGLAAVPVSYGGGGGGGAGEEGLPRQPSYAGGAGAGGGGPGGKAGTGGGAGGVGGVGVRTLQELEGVDFAGLSPGELPDVVLEAEAEMARRGNWRRIFPCEDDPLRYLDLFETPRLNNMTLCKYYMQTSGKGGSSGSRGASGSGAAGGGGAAGPGDKAGGAGRPVSREAGGSVGRGRPGSGKDWRPGG